MGQQPSAQQTQEGKNEEAAWWCRLLARGIGVIGGAVCLICSIFTLITFSPICILSAILMMIAGVVVLIFEAPICCQFIEATQPIARFAENFSYFKKGFLYAVMAILPFALCISLSTLFGCGGVFAAGVFYGLMALGKKADREQMMANASTNVEAGNVGTTDKMDVTLVNNEVRNDNPFSQPPAYK